MHILDKSLCSGCSACAQSCGKKAITMRPDENGFLYPQIDEALCVECGLCQKVCPVLHPSRQPVQKAYAAIAREEVRLESSSGGVFTLLAEHILHQGGTVFGAAFNEKLELHHIGIQKSEQLTLLRSSKYVQSALGDTYSQVKVALSEGKPVLFTGTPCQINGLRSFLGKDYDYLFCQDIICHGVPAPGVWKRYLEAKGNPVGVSFRNKENGWKAYRLRLEYADSSVYSCKASEDPYMQAFLGDLCLRSSCHSCSAKGENHTADLTLGDYWGVEQAEPAMFDDKGTSLVLVHTEKGQQLFDQIREDLRICETDTQKALNFNPAFSRSSMPNKNREKFLKDIHTKDFVKTVNKYRPKHPLRVLKAAIKKLFKRMDS